MDVRQPDGSLILPKRRPAVRSTPDRPWGDATPRRAANRRAAERHGELSLLDVAVQAKTWVSRNGLWWVVSLVGHVVVFVVLATFAGTFPVVRNSMPATFETTLGSGSLGAGVIGLEPGGTSLDPRAQNNPALEITEAQAAPEQATELQPPAPVIEPATAATERASSSNVANGPAAGGSRGSAFPGGSQSGGGPAFGTGGGKGGGNGGTSLFGVEAGGGTKVVYVFDRSSSMGGSNFSPLDHAKAELLASLERLPETHQFQIIFYNELPTPFLLRNESPRLLPATAANKNLARAFLGGIIADVGTQHEEALLLALRMNPDAIYFLTDADPPGLSPGQMDRISRSNRKRIAIHAIEFGRGPNLEVDNFLIRLAQQHYGRYAYVDVAAQSSNMRSAPSDPEAVGNALRGVP